MEHGSRRRDEPRFLAVAVCVVVICGGATFRTDGASSSGLRVVCDPASGAVTVVADAEVGHRIPLSDPLPGSLTAEVWIDENCPAQRCDGNGRCVPAAPPIDRNGWYVLCGTGSGDVGVVRGAVPSGFSAMAGPFADQDGAEGWIEVDCPDRRCEPSGRCVDSTGSVAAVIGAGPAAAQETSHSPTAKTQSSAGGSGGWTVGEILTGNGAAGPARTGRAVGPQRARTDLTPLVDAARASVAACAYQTALANADQMARFDPTSPWLEANHERLRGLAARQQRTEQAIWRAGSLLNEGRLKDARKAVHDAAGSAVACQDDAVSVLLHRIDEVIAHNRAQKQARNARLAGELLAGLFVVNQAVTAHHNGTPVNPGAATAPVIAVIDGASGGSGDPCQFNYSYPAGAWSVEPICGCSGYHYDALKLRCVK